MTIFNFGRSNRLGIIPIGEDHDLSIRWGYWLSGRLLGFYISINIPWRGKFKKVKE